MNTDFQTPPVAVAPTADGFKITFNGPIHTNVSWLERELDRVAAAKPKVVQLDLVATEHISSLGLGLLVGFNNQISKAGGVVKIVAIKKRTVGILRIAFLDKLFVIEPGAIVDVPPK